MSGDGGTRVLPNHARPVRRRVLPDPCGRLTGELPATDRSTAPAIPHNPVFSVAGNVALLLRCLPRAAGTYFEQGRSKGAFVIAVDTPTMTRLIVTCFNLSQDSRLGSRQRDFLVAGKRLRGYLINLISAQFNDDTDLVLDGNRQLTRVTQQAVHLRGDVAAAASLLSEINVVIGVLDELLNLAVSFL